MKKQIKIHYDNLSNSLIIWFEDPKKEFYASETEEEVVLMKDKNGKVIGFEKLNFLLPYLVSKNSALPLKITSI